MKRIYFILSLLILMVSCQIKADTTIAANEKLDTLPLPHDSTSFYFPLKPNRHIEQSNAFDTSLNAWYSTMLFALKEPVLKDYKGSKEIYRFTWLRTFHHPAVVRIERQGNTVRVFSKVTDGAGGFDPGKIIFDTSFILPQQTVDTIVSKLIMQSFGTLKLETGTMQASTVRNGSLKFIRTTNIMWWRVGLLTPAPLEA